MTDTQTQDSKPRFYNPYDDPTLSSDEKRIQSEVSRQDYNLIKLIRPDQGTVKNVINLLWKQLCYELRQRNITDITSCSEFESFLAHCRIVPADEYESLLNDAIQWQQQCAGSGGKGLSNRTLSDNSRGSAKTIGRNVRGGTSSVSTYRANKSPKRSNFPSDPRGEGGQGTSETGGEGESAGGGGV